MQQANRASGRVMLILSLIALLVVISGYFQSPQADEGWAAHIFQLSITALVFDLSVFLATANWKQPGRSIQPLAIPVAVVILAFAALFYLEHYFYFRHHP